MNVFNRLIVVLLAVLTIICSAFTILALALYQGEVIDIFRQVAAAYPRGVGLETEVVIGIGVFAALLSVLAAIVLWFEVVPAGASGVRLQSVGGAIAIVTNDAIVQRVRYETERVPGVRQARASMKTNGREAIIRIDARLAADVPVAPVVDQISGVVREAVEGQMGVRIRQLQVYVRNEPGSARPAPSAAVSPAPPPLPTGAASASDPASGSSGGSLLHPDSRL
ncbi:MAG: alkaline shock response membrane anchor protein AmaP [Chloroflexota bacterium]|nr:alkaline shock response membrane anchor protein AmaP [Dehalococcoidia bacterium]MDW8252996.1 alkaline shock response membrane anchor protein AmaP [Chloroflexota bacterium]